MSEARGDPTGFVPPVIGLTGGIAAGKSTVSERLAARGAHVVDADRVGHRVLMRGGEAYARVVASFGAEILDETEEIVRPRLGRLVFADTARLAELNRLTHPPMAERMRREFAEVRSRPSPPPFIVLDAAVLFEAGWDALCDEVWTVSAHPARALERLVARNRLTPDAARARIEAQLANAEREARAHRVIRNDGTLDELAAAADSLAAAICSGACAFAPPPLR
ncbi:MAG: dephospho-CoA kinase [Immundisolibacterales bacterium]|nr:dephospho-CoA kinase [Immundisolibacterales bacterium]